MIRVWTYDDSTIPPQILQAAYRGGDEDLVIAGPQTDEDLFFQVANALDGHMAHNINRKHVSRVHFEGQTFLVYPVCHA